MAASTVTYRRRNPYNTPSNRVKLVRTPGNKLRYIHVKKRGITPKCRECGAVLNGIKILRSAEKKRAKVGDRFVNRAYGGIQCGTCVRDKILQAFLDDEGKRVEDFIKKSQKKSSQKQ